MRLALYITKRERGRHRQEESKTGVILSSSESILFIMGCPKYGGDEMLTKQDVIDDLNSGETIQNIGQIDADTKKHLEKYVRKGILIKTRERWLGCFGPLKTTYRLK